MATHELQESREYFIFRKHYASLCVAIQDPLRLAIELYSRGIVVYAIKERMFSPSTPVAEKNSALLSAVETQIRTNSQAFYEFISALNEDITMRFLVESIRSKCSTVSD